MTNPDPTLPSLPPNPDHSSLPPSTSPTLHLDPATPSEQDLVWSLNYTAWRGTFPLETYLRREIHLGSQPLTLNGGITYWVLTDSAEDPKVSQSTPTTNGAHVTNGSRPDPIAVVPRLILSSCETFRKRALIAHRLPSGKVSLSTTLAHGIGSVFCRQAFRGRGYAGRMMREVGKRLETWQQPEGQKAVFTVLYSDIGKQFYANSGWKVMESAHVSLPPVSEVEGRPVREGEVLTRVLYASDLKELCDIDEELLRRQIVRFKQGGADTRVALIPDAETMQWHHAREEFATKEAMGRWPDAKGAIVDNGVGRRVWAVWTRTFGAEEKGNVLHILRMVVEGEGDFGVDEDGRGHEVREGNRAEENVQAATAVLGAAQREAARWGMKCVEVWNPSHIIVEAAKAILPDTKVVERDSESITSLMWYGEGSGTGAGNKVEWVGNEKYAWC